MSEFEKPAILAFAPDDWCGRRLNRQHILTRLAARGWPVLYSNGALSVWDRTSPRWRQAGWFDRFEEIEGVFVGHPGRSVPRWQRHPAWDRLAIRRHAKLLRSELGNLADNVICYVFHPDYWPYVEHIQPRYLVYHAYDAFDLMPDWTPQLQEYRDLLLNRADLRVVTFSGISRFYPASLRTTIRELPNGVDGDHFMREIVACPPDLEEIPHPRIGYVGTINPKVDFETLHAVASRRPDWHLVVLGKSDLETESDAGSHLGSLQAWRGLRVLPNVHYLGVRRFPEVPAYVAHMDANTICYRTTGDGWWSFGSPNKLHELLAVGKPVVASPLEAIRPFAHVVDLAGTPDEWIAAIERALDCGGVGTPEERRAVAMRNTWDQRVDVLEGWLLEMCGA